MSPQQFTNWVQAGSLLVNVVGVSVNVFRNLAKDSGVSDEDLNALIADILADAERRRDEARKASGG